MPTVDVRTISARTVGRYLVDSRPLDLPHPLLVGFHGYGENAELHLAKLRGIPGGERWLLAAVQALHRFYDTKTMTVVGSWMTTLDREQAITDNLHYVAAVVEAIKADHGVSDTLVYAGFSQGVAMTFRAGLRAGHRCAGLIALGGDIPPELRQESSIVWPPVLLARGQRDEWYTQEKMDEDLRFLTARDVDVQSLVFDGAHEWTEAFSEAAGEFLRGLSGP